MTATPQLTRWSAEFGNAYTDRNRVDWRERRSAFTDITAGLDIGSILEVGCNRGHNLRALQAVLPGARLAGVEPNDYARGLAEEQAPGCEIVPGDVGGLPYTAEHFDLVFTAGVLIHVPPASLTDALVEIHRLARRWILAIEYFAQRDEVVAYHGREDMLWKRDFLAHYRGLFPELVVIRQGVLGADVGFDDCHWWLMQKSVAPAAGKPGGGPP
jgi:pseudaminic acid biosynthesis-associated methylase